MPAPKRRNSLSFSAFAKALGAPLANVADRWCGISHERQMAVFTVWADRLDKGRYIYWNNARSPSDPRVGAKELHRVLKAVLEHGYNAYGILCEAVDPAADKRRRGYFAEDAVLSLRLVVEDPGIVAYVVGEIASKDVIAGKRVAVHPFDSATDDLSAGQLGTEDPAYVYRVGGGYRRDVAVREYVLRKAGGICESCGALGFKLRDGGYYLEAHHVLALSKRGPDTVANVIALCADEHRQAHYGAEAKNLEKRFVAAIAKRGWT